MRQAAPRATGRFLRLVTPWTENCMIPDTPSRSSHRMPPFCRSIKNGGSRTAISPALTKAGLNSTSGTTSMYLFSLPDRTSTRLYRQDPCGNLEQPTSGPTLFIGRTNMPLPGQMELDLQEGCCELRKKKSTPLPMALRTKLAVSPIASPRAMG